MGDGDNEGIEDGWTLGSLEGLSDGTDVGPIVGGADRLTEGGLLRIALGESDGE